MTNRERFEEAFGHMEHEVMGRRLAKFTLRHRFWLEAMGSPLAQGGEASLLDLEMATRVCEMPYPALDEGVPRMLARGPGRWGRWRYALRVWGRDAVREYRLFQGYLIDHGCPPATWHDGEGQDTEASLPGLLGLVTGLMRGAGWEPDAVWRLSPGEAEWYLAGVFLHRGVDVGVKTAGDELMEAMLKKRQKKEVC